MNDQCHQSAKRSGHPRRGVTLVLAAIFTVVMLGVIAFAIDLGHVVLVRTQLQVAADSAAMAAAASMGLPRNEMLAVANEYAGYHSAQAKSVELLDEEIEYGTWDTTTRTFTPSPTHGNAIRVTARTHASTTGESKMFFGKIFGRFSFAQKASAVAMANPRDICFVVDLSGSMNDDSEPCWATKAINKTFASDGYPTIGNDLVQQLYDDFGYGRYSGPEQYIGKPFRIKSNKWAYAELTRNGGPLTKRRIPRRYRIRNWDNETTRKRKAYSALIDYQIRRVMRNVKPTPNSSTNYAYWEKYLDYIIRPVKVAPLLPPPPPPKPPVGLLLPQHQLNWYAAWKADSSEESIPRLMPQNPEQQLAMAPGAWEGVLLPQLLVGVKPGTPPNSRGWLPPNQDSDRIHKFNNPNKSTFPNAKGVWQYRNQIGYRTYLQFMLDHGRDLKPVGGQYVPLSKHSQYCPWHDEETAGGTFSFPPRAQPMHAARRALIAAIQVVKERNASITDSQQQDWVSIVTFDTLSNGGPVVKQSLTADYDQAMLACTDLQAVGDKRSTTATESGMIVAREHICKESEGGQGRYSTNKIVVLLTDGLPNLYSSSNAEIDAFMAENSSDNFYGGGYYWFDAPLMQAMQMQMDKWYTFPVGVGLGTDYNFMDRMARMGETANDDGESSRGSGNPAEYEQRLTEIFEEIITNPKVRLVQ